MQKTRIALTAFLAVLLFSTRSTAQAQSTPIADSSFIVEDYYKIKWGYADEFIDLWKRNHYPLLKKVQESGGIIEVRAERPVLHSGEDTRWDFKVTIVWKNAELGAGKEDPTLRYRKQLYPDLEKLKRDEQHRFSLLIAHWDVIAEEIKLD